MASRHTIKNIQLEQLDTGDTTVRLLTTDPPTFSPLKLSVYTESRALKLQEIRSRSATRRAEDNVVGSRAFWQEKLDAGYSKVARGYAALTDDDEGKARQRWIKRADKQLHLCDYMSRFSSHTAIADTSAAIVWGFPILGYPPDVVERVSLANAGSRTTRNQRTRRSSVAPAVVDINGMTVTSIEQTVVDIACLNGGEAGLVVADFALHHELTSIERIHELAERQGKRPGIGNVRRMLAVADGRVESPAESRMRWRFFAIGFDVPQPQVVIVARGKTYRVDGYDAQQRAIYEVDGASKYALHQDGHVQAFFDERQRETELRSLGFHIHRATFNDVVNAANFQHWLARYAITPTQSRKNQREIS